MLIFLISPPFLNKFPFSFLFHVDLQNSFEVSISLKFDEFGEYDNSAVLEASNSQMYSSPAWVHIKLIIVHSNGKMR